MKTQEDDPRLAEFECNLDSYCKRYQMEAFEPEPLGLNWTVRIADIMGIKQEMPGGQLACLMRGCEILEVQGDRSDLGILLDNGSSVCKKDFEASTINLIRELDMILLNLKDSFMLQENAEKVEVVEDYFRRMGNHSTSYFDLSLPKSSQISQEADNYSIRNGEPLEVDYHDLPADFTPDVYPVAGTSFMQLDDPRFFKASKPNLPEHTDDLKEKMSHQPQFMLTKGTSVGS